MDHTVALCKRKRQFCENPLWMPSACCVSYDSPADTVTGQIQSGSTETQAILASAPFSGEARAIAMTTALGEIDTALQQMNDITAGFSVSDITSVFTPFLESIETYRKPIFLGTLAGILAITVLQIIFALSNLFCVNWLKPDGCCLGTILQV